MIKAINRIVTFVFALLAVVIFFAEVSAFGQAEVVSKQAAYEKNLKRWNSLSEAQRKAIRKRASQVKPEQVKELKKRMQAFNVLPQEKQTLIKNSYGKYKVLSPKEKLMLRERHLRFKQMPKIQKQEISNRLRVPPVKPPVKQHVGVGPGGQVPIKNIEQRKAIERSRELERIKAREAKIRPDQRPKGNPVRSKLPPMPPPPPPPQPRIR